MLTSEPAAAAGAKERHRREARQDGLPLLDPRKALPKTKQHSYFEFVQNENKKKKLEIQVTLGLRGEARPCADLGHHHSALLTGTRPLASSSSLSGTRP